MEPFRSSEGYLLVDFRVYIRRFASSNVITGQGIEGKSVR
jgi:hypothetical protein